MKTSYPIILLVIVFLSIPSVLFAQQEIDESAPSDSLTIVEGTVVCIHEEVANLRNTKPMCDKYGHLYGLKTSDGTIWSFMINPLGKKLREENKNRDKKVRIWGRLFHKAKIIEVKRYIILK